MLNIGGLQCLVDDFCVTGTTGLMRQSAHAHHLFNTKGKIQGRGLRQHSQALRPLRALAVAQSLLIQPDLPARWRQLPAQCRQQGAFARAIGAEHAQDFPRPYIKGDIRQHDFLIATDLQVFRTQHQWRPRISK